MVDQGTSGCFHDADSLGRGGGRDSPDVRIEYLLVLCELEKSLGCVEQLDESCPVVGEGVVGRLTPEDGVHPLELLLGQWRGHSVGCV